MAKGKSGQVLVVGCSSSEVLGNKIGTGGSMKVAKVLYTTLRKVCRKHKMILAAQCCEHLTGPWWWTRKPWKNSAGSR